MSFALLFILQDALDLPRARREARELLQDAHRLLDLGQYEKAVDAHRRGRDLERRARQALESAVAKALPGLDDDLYETRERASRALLALGPAALPAFDALLRCELTAETRARLQDVVRRLKEVEEDADGRLRLWAEGARASSEYEAERWSAGQAAGRPDTPPGGDRPTAWASKEADAGEEWLELRFGLELRPSKIRVHETYNPGALVKAEALAADGTWTTLWKGKAAAREGDPWRTLEIAPGAPATRTIRLTLDSGAVPGWNEIDAVELIGEVP